MSSLIPFPARTFPAVAGAALMTSILSGADMTGQIMLSGNEQKIDLDSGTPTVVRNAGSDSISIIDFSSFPPKVEHLSDIPNSVIGPPSNIALTADGRWALIANSLKIDPEDASAWIPESYVHVMDLSGTKPRVIHRVRTDAQPSGISITPDGRHALVANRASGTISVLELKGAQTQAVQKVEICEPDLSLSDVFISPDGTTALASVQKGGYLAELSIRQGLVEVTGRKFSVYGQPYRVIITPDGRYGVTAGAGFGDPLDPDALTIIDLEAEPPRVSQHITIDPITESLEVSPDGRLIAAVCMSGSNLSADDPHRTEYGSMVILQRTRSGYKVSQRLPTGRIPEGVAFTADGKYLAVQCHPSKEIWVYRVRGSKVRDTGHRIKTPGFPSSLRAVVP